jgi:hypothetical protein
VGELPGESNDSRVSDAGSVQTDPMDEDILDDGSRIFSNVPAIRRDVEIVLRAAPSDAGMEEGGEEGGCQYCLGPCWARDL